MPNSGFDSFLSNDSGFKRRMEYVYYYKKQ